MTEKDLSQKKTCHRKKFKSEKQAFVRKHLFQRKNYSQKNVLIPETSFGHRNQFFLSYPKRNTFLSKKNVSVTDKKNLSQKKSSVTKKKLSQKQVASQKGFFHRNKFL